MNQTIYSEPESKKHTYKPGSPLLNPSATDSWTSETRTSTSGRLIPAFIGLGILVAWGVTAQYQSAGAKQQRQNQSDKANPGVLAVTSLKPVISNENSASGNLIDSAQASDGKGAQGDRAVLEHKVEMLTRGREFLNTVRDYTAHLFKREVVKGELLDEQAILIKCRHHPFSVYLKWTEGDVGREVIYIEGANHGKMVAHDGGWKARIPAFNLSPDCMLAMRDARYPVTNAGLFFLIDTMLEVHQGDLKTSNFESCAMESNQEFDGRACEKFTTKYHSKAVSPTYRKSITYIDREWNIPLHTEHFDWPAHPTHVNDEELDRETLLESYSFRDLSLNQDLSEKVFDRSNKEYNFH